MIFCFGRFVFSFLSISSLVLITDVGWTHARARSQQSTDTQIYFSPAYWPAFGLWDFIPILFDYQRKVWGGGMRAPEGGKVGRVIREGVALSS